MKGRIEEIEDEKILEEWANWYYVDWNLEEGNDDER